MINVHRVVRPYNSVDIFSKNWHQRENMKHNPQNMLLDTRPIILTTCTTTKHWSYGCGQSFLTEVTLPITNLEHISNQTHTKSFTCWRSAGLIVQDLETCGIARSQEIMVLHRPNCNKNPWKSVKKMDFRTGAGSGMWILLLDPDMVSKWWWGNRTT